MRLLTLSLLGALAALASAQSPTVLGRLGQAKVASPIYTAPSPKAKLLSRAEKDMYLVVRPGKGQYTTVVMKDGRLGYIPTHTVEVLAYEVTSDGAQAVAANKPRAGATYVASRGGRPARPTAGANALASMADYARTWEGTTPYKWGGTKLVDGIDCSGFVQKMAGAIGKNLPRTAAEQANVGMQITRYEDLRKGDRLYFWDAKRGKIGHTGIYLGNGMFVHSSSGHKGIATDVLSARWQKICVAARR